MANLFSRTYRRAKVSRTEKTVGIVILLLLAGLVAAFVVVSVLPAEPLFTVQPGSEKRSEHSRAETLALQLMPPLGTGGWKQPDNTWVFTPANLWEKINGRADLYLSYNMVRMTFGTYRSAQDPSVTMDVYWYDLAKPDNAFGVYRAEYGGDVEPIAIGREGYVAGGSVIFWKAGHYVRVEAPETGVVYKTAGPALARAIAATIPDDGQPLWAEALLPARDRVPGSFEYQARDAFSLDFLHEVFSARYETDGQSYVLFIHRAGGAEEAGRLLAAYKAFFRDYGRLIEDSGDGGDGLLIGESVGVFDAVFTVDAYLGGVTEAAGAAAAADAARRFRAILQGS